MARMLEVDEVDLKGSCLVVITKRIPRFVYILDLRHTCRITAMKSQAV
jgi:hypothetical protein